MRYATLDWAGLARELVDSGGINLTRLDAAASKLKLTPEERIFIKSGLAKLGLLRAA